MKRHRSKCLSLVPLPYKQFMRLIFRRTCMRNDPALTLLFALRRAVARGLRGALLALTLLAACFGFPAWADIFVPIPEGMTDGLRLTLTNLTFVDTFEVWFCEENIGIPCNASTPPNYYDDRVRVYNLGGRGTIDFYSDLNPSSIPGTPPP